jgi:hypothetical protein
MIDLLTLEDVEMIREDVKSVLEDTEYTRKIIYRRLAARVFNPGTGQTTRTTVDTELKAFLGNHSANEVANSGNVLQVGDIFFMFDPALLDSFPQPDDRILQEVACQGHVKLTSSSPNVVGYNTEFRIDGVQGGDVLDVEDTVIPITEVTDNENLLLKSNWLLSNEPAVEYRIYRIFEIVQRIIDPLRAAVRLSVRRAGA